MVFSKGDKVLIKSLYELKGHNDWLLNLRIDAGTRAQDSRPRQQRLEAAPHW